MGLFGKSKSDAYVISKSLYLQQKEKNSLYALQQKLLGSSGGRLYAPFETSASFITDEPIGEKELETVKKLMSELTVSEEQAKELYLAKKMGCDLVVTKKQIWLENVAGRIGVKTKEYL